MGKIATKCKEKILEKWQYPLAIIIDAFIVGFFYKFKIRFWEAEYYNYMLSALITFVSIIISIFGIMIPTVFTGKSDLIEYFKKNADISYFTKSIKNILVSGFGGIGCICFMFLQDKVQMIVFKIVSTLGLFFLLVFIFGSYKYLGIMLKLLVGDKKRDNRKEYKNQKSEDEIKELNKRLKEQNNK